MAALRRLALTAALLIALAATNPAGAWATTTTLPELSRGVVCTDQGVDVYGTAWAFFVRRDSDGARSAYRGGINNLSEWDITQVQTIGVAGDRSYTKGGVTFGSGQLRASEYTPIAYASRSNVELAIYYTIYKNGITAHCAVTFGSN